MRQASFRGWMVVIGAAMLVVGAGGLDTSARADGFLKRQMRHSRVKRAVAKHQPTLQVDFKKAGAAWPPKGVFFRAFKAEKVVEVWAAAPESTDRWRLVRTVQVCRSSGKLGPKVKQGDRQVPEGFYNVKRFSPKSPFHLGLWLSYPNKVDWRRASKVRKSPGGAIRIHGGCVTSGCLPVGNDSMEGLYIAALLARDKGQADVPIHVFPCRFGDDSCEQALRPLEKKTPALAKFWKSLRTGFQLFAKTGKPPKVDATRQGYSFSAVDHGAALRPGAPPAAAPPTSISGPGAVAAKACGNAPAGMSCIPGGTAVRGIDVDPYFAKGAHNHAIPWRGGPDTTPSAATWIQTFYMDQTEVTYEAFKACVKSRKCKRAGPRYRDYDGPTQPVTGISWYDAQNFCKTQGKRLPTEAEWEKAARGPKGEHNPWGNTLLTCDKTVVKDPAKGRSCGVKKRFGQGHKGKVLPVKSKPAGRYGLYDMAGNAEEWVADWYSRTWNKCGDACKGTNPKGPCDGAKYCKGHWHKVVKGGSWYWQAQHATGFHRRPHWPKNKPYHHFGFRCAKDIQ